MNPLIISFSVALITGLAAAGSKLLDEIVVKPALEPVAALMKKWLQGDFRRVEKDTALLGAISMALQESGAPIDDEDAFARWFKGLALFHLTDERNSVLRQQVARALLEATDPDADPPEGLLEAMGWPASHKRELSTLLVAIRMQLGSLDDWQAPIAYADRAAGLGLLREALARLDRLDRLILHTPAGDFLRVAVVDAGIQEAEASQIEILYREELVDNLHWHEFRGIAQVKSDLRLPLADIYLDLGLLRSQSAKELGRAREQMLVMDEALRSEREEDRLQERLSGVLADNSRLVILGGPGAGKTVSLHFIALMLARGAGKARFALDAPYIPVLARLADYARELEQQPTLALCNYLQRTAGTAYACHPRLPDFLRLALENGACVVLLDGLDEVGDDPLTGPSLRGRVVGKVQEFANHWCVDDRRCNHLVVTSRIEGYWDDPVRGFEHAELSPLRPPDEIEAFLLCWYTAHELGQISDAARAERQARGRVDGLLPQVLASPGVRRLATNPLLLTILALIHETVGKLPNRRIKLYEICAQTLIESWRQFQTEMPNQLLAELGEEKVINVLAPLAYRLHQEQPGGTTSYMDWRLRLVAALREEGFEDDADEIAGRFLHHARYEAGLLAERGSGRFGFFHLTFEEYLAAREIARQREEPRRKLLCQHWEDPRWREVILLAAGQLGIAESRRDDVSYFVTNLLNMEPQNPASLGRQGVLAGRVLADIGARSVTNPTRRWVFRALQETMQDLDPESRWPNRPPRVPVRTRYEAGEVLDELGWLPDDLNAWVSCPGCAAGGGDLLVMKYPMTNAQYERFVLAGGYEDPQWWDETGWRWCVEDHPDYRGAGPLTESEYWDNPRFGRDRRGYPVVGVSWYEASAYCRWLTGLLKGARDGEADLPEEGRALVADLLAAGAVEVRLPEDAEWVALTGGKENDRYPWDAEGAVTKKEEAIMARANTNESKLQGTSPVAMCPLGASVPFDLMDMAGNVWEWMVTEYPDQPAARVVRGGSWVNSQYSARCAYRYWFSADSSLNYLGFRCVSPI